MGDPRALLSRVGLFADLDPDELGAVAALLQPRRVAPGALIFRQGARGDGLYLIERGRVQVSIRLPGDDEATLGELGPDDALGEMALADRRGRSASARALAESELWFLDGRAFDALCAELHPSSFKLLRRIGLGLCARFRARCRETAERAAAVEKVPEAPSIGAPDPSLPGRDRAFARLLPCFRGLPDAELDELLAFAARFERPRGVALYREGDPGGALWVVLRGAVELHLRAHGGRRRLAVLGPGKVLGQTAILDGEPHPDGATLRETSIVLELPRAPLERVLDARGPLAVRLLQLMTQALTAAIRSSDMLQAQQTSALASG